jgi:hypothetical protein
MKQKFSFFLNGIIKWLVHFLTGHIFSLCKHYPQIGLIDQPEVLAKSEIPLEIKISERFLDATDILKQMESLVNGTYQETDPFEYPPLNFVKLLICKN